MTQPRSSSPSFASVKDEPGLSPRAIRPNLRGTISASYFHVSLGDSQSQIESTDPSRRRSGRRSRGDWYDSIYERREAAGENVHGEADFVMSWQPGSVLDAGCGTGRVGRELAKRGVRVTGFDIDPEMLETARRKAPDLRWIRHDVTLVRLAERFDAVLMAGNVVNFVAPARRHLAVANMAHHLHEGGLLIDGHSLQPTEAQLADYDEWAAASGLELVGRWSTWQRDPLEATGSFAVSVFRKSLA